jgi:hypothetical protein
MTTFQRQAWLSVALALCTGFAAAQQSAKGTTTRTVRVDVLVTTQSGQPVSHLEEKDFTLWDNNILRMKITSFKLIRSGAGRAPGITNVSTQPQNEEHGEVPVYELTFDAAVAKVPNEYHSLGVQVDRPNLKVVARQGYYAQP